VRENSHIPEDEKWRLNSELVFKDWPRIVLEKILKEGKD